jgi:hypothetical protein
VHLGAASGRSYGPQRCHSSPRHGEGGEAWPARPRRLAGWRGGSRAPWRRFAGHASSPCRPSPPPPPLAVDQEVRSGAAPRRRAEEVRLLAVAQPERCRSDQADGDYKSDMEFTRATGRLQERPERLRLNMSGAGRTRHAVLVGPDTVRRTRQQCHAMVPVGPASSQARGARLPPLLWPSRWLDMLWPSPWLHLHTPS